MGENRPITQRFWSERIAMVGEKQWQQGMAIFEKPFIKAKPRYFDHFEVAQARTWLGEQ